MNHSPAHRDGVLEHRLGQAGALQGVDPADRQGEVDRSPAGQPPGPGVRPALVHSHAIAGRAEHASQQRPRQTGPDDGDCASHFDAHCYRPTEDGSTQRATEDHGERRKGVAPSRHGLNGSSENTTHDSIFEAENVEVDK